MERDIQNIASRLRSHGLRPTRTRRVILETLARAHLHPSTRELQDLLRASDHRFGTATLYQNLKQMVSAGVLDQFLGSDGLIRYDGNLTPHHHWICRKCGRIVDVDVEPSSLSRLRPLELSSGQPLEKLAHERVRVEFHGLCRRCDEGDSGSDPRRDELPTS
jgi:Fe2+ or Zn2+ uptake regulation protein